jgi:hypothetical protein
MAVYRVIVNGKDTGQTVTATSKTDAYADVSASRPLRSDDTVELEKVTDLDIPEVGFMMVDLPSDKNEPIFPIR